MFKKTRSRGGWGHCFYQDEYSLCVSQAYMPYPADICAPIKLVQPGKVEIKSLLLGNITERIELFTMRPKQRTLIPIMATFVFQDSMVKSNIKVKFCYPWSGRAMTDYS